MNSTQVTLIRYANALLNLSVSKNYAFALLDIAARVSTAVVQPAGGNQDLGQTIEDTSKQLQQQETQVNELSNKAKTIKQKQQDIAKDLPKPAGGPSAPAATTPSVRSAGVKMSDRDFKHIANEAFEYLSNKYGIEDPFVVNPSIEDKVIDDFYRFITSRGLTSSVDILTAIKHLPASLRFSLPQDSVPGEYLKG